MNYYEQNETMDNSNLEKFNKYINWFTKMERQGHFSRIDWLCVDTKNRNCSVELKTRFVDINKFDTIFIEPDKYQCMINKYNNEGYIPLYINFMQDADHVAVFDLRKFNKNNTETISKIILDKGDNQVKKVDRMLLPVRQCSYYEFENNKYIKRW